MINKFSGSNVRSDSRVSRMEGQTTLRSLRYLRYKWVFSTQRPQRTAEGRREELDSPASWRVGFVASDHHGLSLEANLFW